MRKSFLSYEDIENLTFSQAKKAFTEYRDIFQKRIKRLSAAGSKLAGPYMSGGPLFVETISQRLFGVTDQQERVRNIKTGIWELVTLLDTENSMSVPLSLSSIRATAKDRMEQVSAGLRKLGIHLTKTSAVEFGRFMDVMHQEYGKKMPNSDMMVQFFDQLKYKNKRRSKQYLMQAYKEWEAKGYSFTNDNQDLFRSK